MVLANPKCILSFAVSSAEAQHRLTTLFQNSMNTRAHTHTHTHAHTHTHIHTNTHTHTHAHTHTHTHAHRS